MEDTKIDLDYESYRCNFQGIGIDVCFQILGDYDYSVVSKLSHALLLASTCYYVPPPQLFGSFKSGCWQQARLSFSSDNLFYRQLNLRRGNFEDCRCADIMCVIKRPYPVSFFSDSSSGNIKACNIPPNSMSVGGRIPFYGKQHTLRPPATEHQGPEMRISGKFVRPDFPREAHQSTSQRP